MKLLLFLYCSPSFIELLKLYFWSDIVLQSNLEVRRLWPLLLINKPLVVALHTWIRSSQFKRSFIHYAKIQFLRRASTLIACSDAIRQDVHQRALVIGNPYDDREFRIIDYSVRKKSIVFLGRLVSDKGADMLLKAFSSLINKDWELTIIGDGPQKDLLENLALPNIFSRTRFTGYLKGTVLVEELNLHEIMVVPSRLHEPWG